VNRSLAIEGIIFHPGEKLLKFEGGVSVKFKGDVSLLKIFAFGVLGLAMCGKKIKGVKLILTNKRLVYVSKTGMITKKSVVPMDAPLDMIAYVAAERGLIGKPSLKVTITAEGKTVNFTFDVTDAGSWAREIREAASAYGLPTGTEIERLESP